MGLLRSACRLVNVLDAIYIAGNYLYRRSLRYTVATAFISFLGYLGNLLPGVTTYNARVALFMPLCVGLAMLTSGLFLKMVTLAFKSRLLTVAQAADLDLMENYRKWNQEQHLAALWDHVFRFEWQLATHLSRARAHSEECPPELCSDEGMPEEPQERGRIKFLRWARFGLARPQPEPRQRYYLGIDLRFLEDWYNGGYFDPSDTKLDEQQSGSVPIERVKDLIGYSLWDSLVDFPHKTLARIWFRLISRAVAMRVAEAVLSLNHYYHTDFFNAQALLWPEVADDLWVASLGHNARTELLRRRGLILQNVFGDLAEGKHMLDHFLVPLFVSATYLRARFDPEYLDGSLGYDVWSDLKWAGFPSFRRIRLIRLMQKAGHERRLLEKLLPEIDADLSPHPLEENGGEAYRTIRIATFINWQGLGRLLRKWERSRRRKDQLRQRLQETLQKAINLREQFTTYLVAMRVHHELTRLHRETYHQLLCDLFRTCQEIDTQNGEQQSSGPESPQSSRQVLESGLNRDLTDIGGPDRRPDDSPRDPLEKSQLPL